MTKVKFVRNFSDLPSFDPTSPVFLDTETAGLYGEVRLLQLYQPTTDSEHVYIIDFALYEGSIQQVKEYLNILWVVCHNATYDLYVLNIVPKKVDDTLYLSKIAFPNLGVEDIGDGRGFGLDKVCYRLGISSIYGELKKSEMQKSGFGMDDIISLEQLQYAATDVIALSMIWPHLEQYRHVKCYQLDILSLVYATQYCRNGMSMDTDQVAKELAETQIEYDANIPKLNGLNINSPKQCREALGTESSDKPTLLRLIAEGNELAKLIYDQRRIGKRITMLTSYLHPKTYTVFNVAGAATGRFTATGKGIKYGINAQQIPRKSKHLFVSTDPNVVTIEADYSTLELRLAAAIFGDYNMAQQLRDGKDLHTEVAKALAKKEEITKDDRFKAKAVNFGFVYGMSAKSFREYAFLNYDLVLSEVEATEWRNTYFRLYPDIAKYHKKIWETYKNPGFLQYTALGRPVKPKLGTDAINSPVQGTGAECTKLALHYMVKENPNTLKCVVNVVHDSIKLEVPAEGKEYWCQLLEECMVKAWHEMCKCDLFKFKDIPIKVDVEVKYGAEKA